VPVATGCIDGLEQRIEAEIIDCEDWWRGQTQGDGVELAAIRLCRRGPLLLDRHGLCGREFQRRRSHQQEPVWFDPDRREERAVLGRETYLNHVVSRTIP